MKLNNSEPCSICGRYASRGISIDVVIVKNGQILLIQRGVEPNKGFWGTPGGYVGWDESAEETVTREVKEETSLDVKKVKLVKVSSDPKRHPKQVINLVYLVEVNDGDIKYGDDALDAKWFPLNNLPEKLALDHRQNIEEAIKLLNL